MCEAYPCRLQDAIGQAGLLLALVGDYQVGSQSVYQGCSCCHGSLQHQVLILLLVQRECHHTVLDGCRLPQLGTFIHEAHQFACYGNLAFGFFRERHSDGITQSLGEQGTYAHGTSHASVLSLASLGDSQVQGEVHVLAVHRFHKKAY